MPCTRARFLKLLLRINMGLQEALEHYGQVAKAHHARLIAVSKTHPAPLVQQAYDLGQRVFGENRVQELVDKYELLPKDIEWHLIGHLQKNKVKYIAPFVALIHSIDSLELLQEVDKQAAKVGRVIPCLLQVHIADEESKYGFEPEQLTQILGKGAISQYNNVKVVGLMGMATFTENKAKIAQEFATLRQLFEVIKSRHQGSNISMEELSMGMSGDYEIALAHGSTLIRVGTAIFGNR